jgi:hypothetical protein
MEAPAADEASSSFLKKRTKKLLLLGLTLPDRTATATEKSFASRRAGSAFSSEKKTLLPIS